MDSSQPELVFFDVETVRETKAIIEFGAIIVCPQTLGEKEYFSSLVLPRHDWEFGEFEERRNGLDIEDIISSDIVFSDIAHTVYDMLHGRIWVGHNIKKFDCGIVEDAFHQIRQSPPEPLDVIDTLELCEMFGEEVDNLRPEFSNLLRAANNNGLPRFPDPEEYSILTLRAYYGTRVTLDQVRGVRLPIFCASLNVRWGVGPIRFRDDNGRPKLSFVVDAPRSLTALLDECENMLRRLFQNFGINSAWRDVVDRTRNSPAVRLRIEDTAEKQTRVCKREAPGKTRRLVFNQSELETLLTRGTNLDAYFFLETYDYRGSAGIRLAAHKLIIHA